MMKAKLIAAVIALLSFLAPAYCIADYVVVDVSRAEANAMGVRVRTEKNGDAGLRVWLEFKATGKLKDFGRAELRISEEDGFIVAAPLRIVRRTPETVQVQFSADANCLPKISFWIFDSAPLGGTVYRFNVQSLIHAFEELFVTIRPFGMNGPEQTEDLRIEGNGRCWYRIQGHEATPNRIARPAAIFDHQLSSENVERLNKLLEEAQWLTASGAEGRATHTHPTTITLTLRRDGTERTVVCHGRRPEPYKSLLHAIQGLALQEKRVYLWKYVRGEAAAHAWAEIGREIASLRGDPYSPSPFEIDYTRYLPIARDILYPFYSRDDGELIPAVRLAGHFKLESELQHLHRLAHDRSLNLRREIAWALGRIHAKESLPVLVSMMPAPGNREAAALELIQWSDDAVPHIVKLIQMSTNDELEHWQNVAGEDMIRAYLDHWEKLEQPIDSRVTAAVRQALESADPENGLIRTTYQKEYLRKTVPQKDHGH